MKLFEKVLQNHLSNEKNQKELEIELIVTDVIVTTFAAIGLG